MFDLLFLAFQSDITRVVTFQIGRELSLRSYPEIGVPEAHHEVSHHGERPRSDGECTRINDIPHEALRDFVERMAATPDGDGSLLDHSILLSGAAMGKSDLHSPHNLPIALSGGGAAS